MTLRMFTTFIVLLFSLVAVVNCLGQNRNISDSLLVLLKKDPSGNDTLLFEINHRLSHFHPNPDTALYYAFQAKKIANKLEDIRRIARSLESIGVNNRLLGNKKAGFQASFRALAIYDSLKMPYKQAFMLMQIGEHMVEDENYVKAIIQMEKSAYFFDSLNNKGKLLMVMVNLGEAYRLNKNLNEAINIFGKALELNGTLNHEVVEGYVKGNLGLAYSEVGDFQISKTLLEQAMQILKKLGDLPAISVYLAELGAIHIQLGQDLNGEQELKEALDIAVSESLKKQIRDISAKLSAYYFDKKQFQLAYTHQKQFQLYQDSLVNVPNIRKIEEIKSKYELNKKDIENEKLALENKQKRSELLFTITAVLLLSILIVIVYYAYRSKQKSNKVLRYKNDIITHQVQERELLHKEIHHRVKNNLQLIGSIMGLQSQTSENEELSAAMSVSKTRVEAMTIIHQNLFAEDHKVQINISEYLEKLVTNLRSTYQDQIQSIAVNSVALDVIADDAIPIGLIINEAVCNTVKYQKDQSLDVKIDFYKTEDGYVLQINDNGPGFSDDENQGVGFGTKLIHTLAKQLRAELSIESTSGTIITLLLKKLSCSELSTSNYKEP